MIWHPLTLTLWLLIMLSWMLYIPMLWRMIRVLPHWAPAASDGRQLRRERHMEWVAHQGRWIFFLQTALGVLLIVGISSVWPAYVPGAMCGTGVLQAMGPAGGQTLVFQILLIGVLSVWRFIQSLDATQPYGRLVLHQARLLLLAAPLMAVVAWAWVRALVSVNGSPPVSCCAVVYAGSVNAPLQMLFSPLHGIRWLEASLLGAGAVAAWGAWQWRCRQPLPLPAVLSAMAVVLIWVCTAVAGLRLGVAPHIYQALNHPCVWCLFLPGHGFVGYLYFGLLTWIVAQNLTLGVSGMLTGRVSQLDPDLARRRRRAGVGLMLGALGFALAVVWPVLVWRWRYGAWLI